MADEKEKKPKDAKDAGGGAPKEEQAADAAKPDKTKMVVISLISLAVVMMVLTPVITIFAVRAITANSGDKTEKAAKEKESAAKGGVEVLIKDFKFNVAGTQGTRMAMVDVALELNKADIKKFFAAKSDTEQEGMLVRVTATILNILSDKPLDGLLSKEAKSMLAKEIKTELNEMLQKKTADGLVTEVYFPKFMIQ
jgi:flagellar basal body-associated protein FliL